MSKRMKRYRGDLHLLGTCSPNTRKSIFKNCDSGLIEAVADAVHTVLEKKVPLSPKQIKRLRKDQKILRVIAARNRSVKQKRKLLSSQKGGSIIGFLFNALKTLF